MELTPSDRPRPQILRVRRRQWWNQRSFWVLLILLALFMAAAAWMIHQLYYSENGVDLRPGSLPPRPSTSVRAV